jgi:hypothetical protein
MLSIIYAECRKLALYTERRYAECHYAEGRYAECHFAQYRYPGAFLSSFTVNQVSCSVALSGNVWTPFSSYIYTRIST